MQSELIQEIFSVEEKAERIVKEAKETCRQRLAKIHEDGEMYIRETIQNARNKRFGLVEQAQADSTARIKHLQESLSLEEADAYTERNLIEKTAEELVHIVCSSKCGEVGGR